MGPTKEQYADERRFFLDYWSLRKKYYSAEKEQEDFWEGLVRDVNDMERRYPGKYHQDLLFALVTDIEQRNKNGEMAGRRNETNDQPGH